VVREPCLTPRGRLKKWNSAAHIEGEKEGVDSRDPRELHTHE